MTSPSIPWYQAMLAKVAHLPKSSERAQQWENLLVAVHFRVIYFGYHREEFHRLVAEEESANIPEIELEQAFSAAAYGEPAWQQLSMNAVLAAAHLTAAAQSMHSACDNLCKIAYWSLGLNTTALSLSLTKLNFRDVVKHAYGQSRVELEKLGQSEEFRYLDAVVDTSRHRHLIGALPSLTGNGGKPSGGLAILGFQYSRGATACDYPPKCAKQFLGGVCEKLVDQCNTLGNTLAHDMV